MAVTIYTSRTPRLLADLDAEIADTERKLQALKAARRALAPVYSPSEAITTNGNATVNGSVQPSMFSEPSNNVSGKADAALAYLRDHPGADFGSLAKAVYGESDDKARHKVRSLIVYLARKKLIHAPTRGRWEVSANC